MQNKPEHTVDRRDRHVDQADTLLQGRLDRGIGAEIGADALGNGEDRRIVKRVGDAKAGFQRWDLDRSIPSIVGNTDDNGTDPTYGLGVQYRFTDNVALRGEYSRFEVEDTDLDLAQIQVRYDF